MTAAAVGLLVGASALMASCGPMADEPTGVEHQAVVGGTVDKADPAVVALVHRAAGCDAPVEIPNCSGTLIAPRVVLTAAHCVADVSPDTLLEVFFGSDVKDPGPPKLGVVITTAVHPKYDPSTNEYDVALLRLAEDPKVSPLPFGAPPGAVGSSARVVGFGIDGGSDAGPSVPGTKRQGNTKVSAVTPTSFSAVPSPAMSCSGDSGGPVLAIVGDAGVESVVGVTAKGDTACKDHAFNVRVDAVRAFIDSFVKDTATAPSGEPAGSVPLSAVCTQACAAAADCPDGLACRAGDQRCGLPGAAPTSFDAVCDATRPCSGGATCTRLWTSGANACRCATPCPGGPPPPDAGPPRPDVGVGVDAASDASVGPRPVAAASGCTCTTPMIPSDLPTARWALAAVVTLAVLRRRRRTAAHP